MLTKKGGPLKMEKIENIGGSSQKGAISYSSDQYTSVAILNQKGKITCTVTPHSPPSRLDKIVAKLPIPKLMTLLASIIANLSLTDWLIFILYEVFGTISLALLFAHGKVTQSKVSSSAITTIFHYWWIFFTLVVAAVLLYFYIVVAKWHGAEHMVMSSYERTGKIKKIQVIMEENTVHSRCGGKLFIPIFSGLVSSLLFAHALGFNKVAAILITIEAILWIDDLIGFDKIPITSHASFLIQKYISTRRPDEQELLVARRALQGLISAHRTSK